MNPLHEHVIQTRGLSKSFNDIHALRPLDLTVKKNSIVGFLGPNGAGKTTAIKLLLGLIRPTRGEGEIFGHDIVRESIKVRRRVGYLPQDPRFFEYMTPRKTLEFTARFFFRGPAAAIDQRVEETLVLVGLSDKADRPIKGFSGGERQRLGIAQAQVHYPDLILLDEPAAALDPLGRRDVLEVMSRLRKHATIFFCTHILDDVQRVSDSVAILNRGELVAQGSIDELLAGSSGVAYAVTVKGEAAGAQARISNQPWVKEVQTKSREDGATLLVSVSDSEAAEAQPGVIAFFVLTAVGQIEVSVVSLLAGMGIFFLSTLFWLAFPLMLGSFFGSRGPVIGIPLAMIFGQQFLTGLVPWLALILPFQLVIPGAEGGSVVSEVIGGSVPASWVPVYVAVVLIVLLTAIAVWRFGREEL